MMYCNCGNRSLFFEKTVSDGVFNVFKCDAPDGKKKGKCDFFYTEKIKDAPRSDPIKNIKPNQEIVHKEENPRKHYIKCLNRYIKLYKSTIILPGDYSKNYIANINYILKRLHMPFYFDDIESIESLEVRIMKNIRVEYIKPINVYPIKITDYPSELAVNSKVKKTKKRKSKPLVDLKKIDLKVFIEKEEEKTNPEENDRDSLSSDCESELSVDAKDNTFDIEECDSDPEDQFDDTGAFSD
tara:strand:- start:6869 stop:7591 length:723 start_codon:yes stop_codon:yes gene_type:complete